MKPPFSLERVYAWMYHAPSKIAPLLPFPAGEAQSLREMRLMRDPWLLHVSDTPVSFYRPLKQLIRLLAPRAIIHTGDLADNVKIDLSPEDLPLYRRRVHTLGSFLDSPRTYIVLGNHDNLREAARAFPQSTLFAKSRILSLEGVTFGISHRVEDLPERRADFYLYGHNDASPPEKIADLCRNGLEKIHCCNLRTGEWRFFDYPSYVRHARSRKFRIGL